MQAQIENLIEDALRKLGMMVSAFSVEHPAELSHGDYSTNAALVIAKLEKKNPRDLAEKIAEEIRRNLPATVARVETAGGGFINFFLSDSFFARAVAEILSAGRNFGSSSVGAGKKVLVDYSSPNVAKPFGIGHLRSTIIGDAIANILAFSGYKVIRDNHLGDWGTQFGKLLFALEKWEAGDISRIEKSGNPIKELVDLYVRFHDEAEKSETAKSEYESEAREWFRGLEEGSNAKAVLLWKKCIDISKREFAKTYARLKVSFDTELGESFFVDKTAKVYEALAKKGLMKKSEGADVVFFENDFLPPLIVRKADDTSIYAARDLAADLYRKETYGENLTIINEVGSEQGLYFRQIFETEKMLGWFKEGERVHVAHGLYRFADGKMSTRKGKIIWLEEVLDEAVKRAEAVNKESAEIVGVGAIKFNDLKRNSRQDIVFDWNDILNLKGDSGPYLQYTAARANSVLEKAKEENIPVWQDGPPSSGEVEKLLYRFPEIVERAAAEYSPQYIASYLIDLAGAFNSYYGCTKIIDSDAGAPYRVALTGAVSIVIKNGLGLLGIDVPEKM